MVSYFHKTVDRKHAVKAMAQVRTWFPPGLVFREWQLNRGWYLLAGILLVLPYALILAENSSTFLAGFFGKQFIEGFVFTQLESSHAMSFPALVAVGLGVGVFWHDRLRGDLESVLAGPVRRRDLIRTKAGFGLVLIFGSYALILIFILGTQALVGVPVTVGAGLTASAASFLMLSAWYMTAMAASSAIGNPLMAVAATLLTASMPALISLLVGFLGNPPPSVTNAMLWLSPIRLSFLLAGLGSASLWYFAWYVAWIAGFWRLSRTLWDRAPMERFSETFFFPRLWYVVLAVVAFLLDDIFLHLGNFANGVPNRLFAAEFVVLYAITMLILRALALKWVLRRQLGTETRAVKDFLSE